MIFYSVVREIWQLDYNIVKVPIFKCDWVKNDTSVKVDNLGFTLVDYFGCLSDAGLLCSGPRKSEMVLCN